MKDESKRRKNRNHEVHKGGTKSNLIFNDYTYNTGNCVTHQANMPPEAYEVIHNLMVAGKGDLPGITGATYDFMEYGGDAAGLTVDYLNVPAHISIFCPSDVEVDFALSNLDETAQYFRQQNLPCDKELFIVKPPCNITLIIPSMIMIPFNITYMLGSVPKAFAEVWLTKILGNTPPSGNHTSDSPDWLKRMRSVKK